MTCHHKPTDLKSDIEPDPELTNSEQVPLLYEGSIDAFMKNKMLPYAPNAYVDESKTQVGYELSFTKYFYKPTELRPLSAIEEDILAIEHETDGLPTEILGR